MTRTRAEALAAGERLLEASGVPDAAFDARELLLSVLGCDRTALHLTFSDTMTEEQGRLYEARLRRRAGGEPLQYILGEWDFCGRTFLAEPGVLIPRPETEELTARACELLRREAVETVFDLGGGTGCIGLTLALENPTVNVYIFELYDQPLRCIEKNKALRNVQNAGIIKCDITKAPDSSRFPTPGLLISNPPYIETDALDTLQREVRREPRTALDGGADGLLFYRAIAEKWYPLLCGGGHVFLECGEKQPQAVCRLFPQTAQSRVLSDFCGQERFVTIQKP